MHEVCHAICRPTIMHIFVEIIKFITNRSHLLLGDLAIGAIPRLARPATLCTQ